MWTAKHRGACHWPRARWTKLHTLSWRGILLCYGYDVFELESILLCYVYDVSFPVTGSYLLNDARLQEIWSTSSPHPDYVVLS